jgi:hypothetical protein
MLEQLYANLIAHYKRWKASNPDTWVEHAANQTSLHDAITVAAASRDADGKKHPHQYRLQNDTLNAYGANLHNYEADLRQSVSFDDIMEIAYEARIPGIGELAVYDTAIRIGSYLDIWPENIYLHAGARVGAYAIVPNLNSNVISREELPEPFRSSDLTGYDLEDMLCIYKKVFSRPRQ